jgi:hypothetical protein
MVGTMGKGYRLILAMEGPGRLPHQLIRSISRVARSSRLSNGARKFPTQHVRAEVGSWLGELFLLPNTIVSCHSAASPMRTTGSPILH